MKKPIIGITTFRENNSRGIYNSINYDYAKSILESGGIPVYIPVTDKANIKYYLGLVDGILFSGGEDISPLAYGENPKIEIGNIDVVRDDFELELFRLAFEQKKSILGICRGLQLVNVACGGTLYQDIDSQIPEVLGHHPNNIARSSLFHSIKIIQNTKLHSIFEKDSIYVNSFHHQSIKQLGKNLIISGISEDKIIEAIEFNNLNSQFLMAVQWHPENLCDIHKEFLNLFKIFVDSCK